MGKIFFESFVTWKNESNVRYETTPIALGIKLKNLKIDGVSKRKDLAIGKTKLFDFIKLRKYFNIGCQIDLYAEEDKKTPSYDAVLENNCNSDEYEFVEED
jgi:hypothetical protein